MVRDIDFHCSRWWHPSLATAETVTCTLREDLTKSTTGNKATLKDSQHYPKAFGDAVAAVHQARMADLLEASAAADARASKLEIPDFEFAQDLWEDAGIPSVEAFLRS